MATGIISSTLALQPRPTPPTEPPARVAAALIAASRGPAGVDMGKLAAKVAALDPRDPATAPVRAAVNAALAPVDRGRLAAALDRATADISVRLKDGAVVVADRDASNAAAKTLAAYRDSADPKDRAVFRSVIATYGSIPAAEAALFGPRPAQVASTPSTPPVPAPAAGPANKEGVGAFFEGALAGDLSDNNSWSKVGGQVAMGFVPVAGQIADIRDIGANIDNIREGKPGGWFGLGTAAIGIIPGVGDAAKAALRGGGKVAEAGAEVAEQVAKRGDEVAGGVARAVPPEIADVLAKRGPEIDAASLRTGVSRETIARVLATEKGSRPSVDTYMSAGQIARALAKFDEGAVRFTSRANFEKYGTLGLAGGFVMPAGEFKALVKEAGGDLSVVERRLALDPGQLTSGGTLIAFVERSDLSNLRLPTGNEAGANQHWLPGGSTAGGVSEAVMDFARETPFTELTLGSAR
jgi:hypothetical protein